jgi:type VI secretion system secreted protein VgrG
MNSSSRSFTRRVRRRASERGLSTVEYVVVLVLIAVVAIGAWRAFGQSVVQALGVVDRKFEGLGQSALGEDRSSPSQPAPENNTPAPAPGVFPPSPPPPPTPPPPPPPPPAAPPAGAGGGGAGGGSSAQGATGLGANVDGLISKSPTATQNVQNLRAQGWTLQYGPAGGGTYTDLDTKVITLDANEQGNPSEAAISVAHEASHALVPVKEVPPSGLTRAEYIKKNVEQELRGEAAATLNNAQARDEILSNGGPDIGIAGGQSKQYAAIYKQYKAGKITRVQAEQKIAQAYGKGEKTSNTNQNYRKYYEQFYAQSWDAQYPKSPKDFRAP